MSYPLDYLSHHSVLIHALVLLVVFSVLLENSGLLKAGPKQSEYEPLQGNTVKFDAVHGCDEVKDVSYSAGKHISLFDNGTAGTTRRCRLLEGSHEIRHSWRQAAQRCTADRTPRHRQNDARTRCRR